jgi:metallo-beta-lactamase family protein
VSKLTFYNSAKGVSGSAYLLETDSSTILLDCGLIQGRREEEKLNEEPFPFNLKNLDAVVLSHAHLDHSGRIPKLVGDGYKGPISMTYPTYELLAIMLKDAAFLEKRDTEWENKRRKRAGKPEIQPLFTLNDVDAALRQCEGMVYDKIYEIAKGIQLCFREAGHILGSAIVEIFITEKGSVKKLVFSGDLGNSYAALLRDPATIKEADVLLMESTYGNRNHRSLDETLQEFEEIITKASKTRGNVLIPSFAVGRTQELIFRLGELYQKGKLKQQAIYLDSPMAIAATEVYHRHQDVYNREDMAALRQAKSGSLHSFLPTLRYSQTTEESIAISRIESGAIIIAGSGMCNGGRIRHHLKHNLWKKKNHVIIAGFQVNGTPGRALIDGAKTFHIGGEEIAVNAKIHTLGGFSAHAGQTQLIDWIRGFKNLPRTFLVHGNPEAKTALSEKLAKQGFKANIPEENTSINI